MKNYVIDGNKLYVYSSVKLGYELIDEGEIQFHLAGWFTVKKGKSINCYYAREHLFRGPKAVNEVKSIGSVFVHRRGDSWSVFNLLTGEKTLGKKTEYECLFRRSLGEVALVHSDSVEFIKMNDYHSFDGNLRYGEKTYRGSTLDIVAIEIENGGSRYFWNKDFIEIDPPFLTVSLDDDGKTKTLLSARIDGVYQVFYACHCIKPLDGSVIEVQEDQFVLKRLNRETCEVEELGACKEYCFDKVGNNSILRFGEKSWRLSGEEIVGEWYNPDEIIANSGGAALLSHQNREEAENVPEKVGVYGFFRRVTAGIWNNFTRE